MTHDSGRIETCSISRGRLSATILNLGSTLMDLSIDLPEGRRSVILRHSNPGAYAGNPHYLGVIAGRCANRIRGGQFDLDGRVHQLDRNENGVTHLHGGSRGFPRVHWTLISRTDSAIELGLHSPDGDQGYPGNLDVTCRYEALDDDCLKITLGATTDAATLVNLAAHAYFNLSPGSSVLDHRLQVRASHYTPVDRYLIPDGRLLSVAGTCFDFRETARIGALREESSGGYDHNLVLNFAPRPLAEAVATLISPSGDLTMELRTTEPGLQFYDGQKLSPDAGDPHSRLGPFDGCCLEPQRFPDAVHHPHFPQALLRPGESYRQVTEYHFRQ